MQLKEDDFQRTKDELMDSKDSLIYPMEAIKDAFIPLCVNLKVPLDTVLKGEVKTVKKKGAQMLLDFYKIDFCLEKVSDTKEISDESKNAEIANLKTT